MEGARSLWERDGRGNSIHFNVCASCGLTENHVMACSRCKIIKYCSRECQRAHWSLHRGDCVPYTREGHTNVDPSSEVSNRGHVDNNETESRTVGFSLDRITQNVKNAIDQGSRLVFYCHMEKHWLAVMPQSALTFQVNVSFMKSLFQERHIQVRAWDCITIDGVTLYPMVVKFPGQECPAWTLIAQRGILGDSVWTPYLFVNEEARRKTMDIIMNDNITVPRADELRVYL